MTPREERGLIIAATCQLNRTDDGSWLVPSQSQGETIYRVNLETKACTCLDCVVLRGRDTLNVEKLTVSKKGVGRWIPLFCI